MTSQLSVINALMEIYKTYRPAAEVAAERLAILHSLDEQQLEALQVELITRNKGGDQAQLAIIEDVMSDLLLCTNFSIDTLLKAQLDAGWTPLDYLFRGAGEQTEALLWARLETNPTLSLSALAWIDNPHILSKFAEWKNNPPDWQPEFSAAAYSHQAGWELNDANEKRWLFSKTCYGLRAKPKAERESEQAKSKPCLWCNRPTFAIVGLASKYMKDVFDIVVDSEELSIPFCLHCTNFGAVPMLLSASGVADFSKHNDANRKIDEPYIPLKTEGGNLHLQVDPYARNPFSAVDSGRTYNLSQIGGFPTWTQSAQYPKCVECTRTMVFVMQVESMDFPVLTYEGIYHIFACEYCQGELAVQQAR